jgi:hypothetical protein
MTTIRLQHNSMQFSDTKANHQHDAKAVFDHALTSGALFVTGTEAAQSRDNHDLRDALIIEARAHGFRINASRAGEWVALNRKLGEYFDSGYAGPFIKGTTGLDAAHGAHAPRGVAWVTAQVPGVGQVTQGVAHYLTKASMIASRTTNQPLVEGIGKWGFAKGRGRKIVFFSADANERDNIVDVFHGKPFTTIADELGKHPKTHGKDTEHGTAIDIIASYDADGRVKAKSYRVLDDSDVKLFTDHFILEAAYTIGE